MESLIAPAVNLTILIAALVYALKDKLREFVQQRHLTLKTEIETVRNDLSSAQARFEEYQAKLKAIDAELDEIQSQAKRDVEEESKRIVTEAKATAESIVRDAKSASEQLQTEVVDQLTRELGLAILDSAEGRIRQELNTEDRKRIRAKFSAEMGGVQ